MQYHYTVMLCDRVKVRDAAEVVKVPTQVTLS